MYFTRFSPASHFYKPCPVPYYTALPSIHTSDTPVWRPVPAMSPTVSRILLPQCIFTLNATHPGDGLEVEIANLFFPYVVDIYEARDYFNSYHFLRTGASVELRRVTCEAFPVNGTNAGLSSVVVQSRSGSVIVVVSFSRRRGYTSRVPTTPYTIRFRAKENGGLLLFLTTGPVSI